MDTKIFVNVAFSDALKTYEKYKNGIVVSNYDSFYVIVIRCLIGIYGDLDILNPYRACDENLFDSNLMKFGLSKQEVDKFKENYLNLYQNPDNIETAKFAFLEIEKTLIDMFLLRKSHILVPDEEVEKFKKLLYFDGDTDPKKLELYNKYTPNSKELREYYSFKDFKLKHKYNFSIYNEIALSTEAYQLAGFNAGEVLRMKDNEIENINNKVYHFFRIKGTDNNKKERLEDAILYYKKYGNALTSGNGYVDLLLVLGVVATSIMFLIIVGIKFVG